MQNIIIKNEFLTVEISPIGAELQSIKTALGRELLWQGNPEFWSGRSTNLFPFIGRLFEGRYTHNGNSYPMEIHGFAKNANFSVDSQDETEATFSITDDEKSRTMYPFSFCFGIKYTLTAKKLSVVYSVENKSDETMYYGVGGHPGFNLPLADGLDFSDYYIEMNADKVYRSTTTDNKLMSGDKVVYPELADNKIKLKHELFDDDAFILCETSGSICLKSDKDEGYIKVDYPDMKHCAFWHAVGKEAPYVCVEPWTGVPGRDNIVEELSKFPDMISSAPGEVKNFCIDYEFVVK